MRVLFLKMGEEEKKERNTIRNIMRMTKLVATINYQMAAKSPGHDERNIIKGVRNKQEATPSEGGSRPEK